MPIYEYRCNACGHTFEVAQRMSDDPIAECEACGGEVSKVLFAPAIHFKGTGFHNTDYGTRSRPVGGEEGGGGGDGSSDNGGGGDSGSGSTAEKATAGASGSSDSSSGSSSGKTVGLDKV